MAGVFANKTTLTMGSAIAELTTVDFTGLTLDTIDVTTMDSEDQFREFVGGLKDGGEVSIEGLFENSAEANVLVTLLSAGTKTTDATIAYPTKKVSTLTFDCYVTSYEVTAPHDGAIGFSATLKVTGKPVFTQAT